MVFVRHQPKYTKQGYSIKVEQVRAAEGGQATGDAKEMLRAEKVRS